MSPIFPSFFVFCFPSLGAFVCVFLSHAPWYVSDTPTVRSPNRNFYPHCTSRKPQELYLAFNGIRECGALTMLDQLQVLDLEGYVVTAKQIARRPCECLSDLERKHEREEGG